MEFILHKLPDTLVTLFQLVIDNPNAVIVTQEDESLKRYLQSSRSYTLVCSDLLSHKLLMTYCSEVHAKQSYFILVVTQPERLSTFDKLPADYIFTTPFSAMQLQLGIKNLSRWQKQIRGLETTLAENEMLTNAILEANRDGMIVVSQHHQIVSFDKTAAHIFGYLPHEIIGKPFESLLTVSNNELEEILLRLSTDHTYNENRYGHELTGLRKDGKEIPLELSVSQMQLEQESYLTCIIHEITRRRVVEDALERSEAIAHTVLKETVDGIITINEKGIIETANVSAGHIFGYEHNELIGQNIKILMPDPYHTEHDHYVKRYLETGEKRIIGIGREVTGKRKDGTLFPMELAVSEIKLKDRIIFSGLVRDISERRRLERELLEISDQERRRIGQDLHDGLGQMLTGISLLCESLALKLDKQDHALKAEARKITTLISEADEYARLLARGLVPIQLETNGLETALQRLISQAEKIFKIKCTFETHGTMPVHSETIATHLYRITQEAISNAVKHGKATQVSITLFISTDQIRLRIHDNGIGFPDKLGENRGMGVYIMHYRARIIGGNLKIQQAVQGGTLLTCAVPVKSL